MRLKRLDLKAFGPFTGRTLTFDSDEPGLHIVFGPNEAGKSSSLRALKALLYGFDERTTDNFRHANNQLLVGGCIEGTDGRELAFLRRKKRKADMLDPDGNPMDPGMLAAFLLGIEPALFESLYGIDHKTLVEGGEDILAQKGEVGQALFAAGAGISSLRKILESLDAEADRLFKARGAKQQINMAVKAYKDLKKIVKDSSLRAGKWKEHKKRLQEAEAEQAALEAQSRQKGAEVQRLDRLKKAIPELAECNNLKQQLLALGDVVLLPPEFQEQLRQVEREIRETKLQIEKDRDRLKKLQTKQDGICLNQTLLDHAETIEHLYQRIGEYRKGQNDRVRLDGMRIAHRRDAGARIQDVRPDLTLADAGSLRPVLGRKRGIQDLSSRHEVLTQQASQARKRKDEAQKALEAVDGALSGRPAPRESAGLAKAIKLAQKAGDIDGQVKEIAREIDAGKRSCGAELERRGLWSGTLDQLMTARLPLQETVRRFEADFGVLDREREQLKKERQRAEAELKAARADAREAAYGGDLPSEQELEASRKKRQDGWQLLRRQWIDGEDISKAAEEYAPGRPVAAAYERHVEQADHIADRLRREADRVAKAASLRARIENLGEAIEEVTRLEREVARREEKFTVAWRAVWQALRIKPLSPQEMLAWQAEIEKLQFKVTETLNREDELTERERVRRDYRRALVEEVCALEERATFSGRELAPVLIFAESVLEDITRHEAEREKLCDKRTQTLAALDMAQKEQEAAEAARADWERMWNKALTGLGLKEQLLPAEALDLLETVFHCLDKLEKAGEFQSRIDGIDRDAEQFGEDVRILLDAAAPELKDLPPDQAVRQLHAMLGKARQDDDRLKKSTQEAEVLGAEIGNGGKNLKSLDGKMAELLTAARCHVAADLAEAIVKSVEYQRLQEKISNAESALAKVSEGVPIEELQRQADEVDVDELPGRIAALKREIDEDLYPRIGEMLKRIGEEGKELKLMDGSGRAAEAAEKMEQVAAGIRGLVDRYTRIKLAAKVLRDEMERYREEHQDPILQIASGIFSRLTLGSFAGLRTDVGDNGNPILVGVRPDETRVRVEGLSDGTRDQLYLALRLATLEWRLGSGEPMPFIVDDILINFDDQRSRATLKVLAALSEKNQVILFTHHGRIVEEARQLGAGCPVHIHELN